jgi:hypothetical protein
MTFAFTIFGRKVIALAGTVILLFLTAVLIDLRMYVSAGLAGVLAFAALSMFFVQYRRQIKANRLREQRAAEADAVLTTESFRIGPAFGENYVIVYGIDKATAIFSISFWIIVAFC